MKRFISIFLVGQFLFLGIQKLHSQSNAVPAELGIDAGALTNFPANQHYLSENITVFYLTPYIRTGQHEFSAGFAYPTKAYALFSSENKLNPCMGATAGYKFYIFNAAGRENLYVHYSFEYLRFRGSYETSFYGMMLPVHWDETDMYINNVIGLGYNLFFDANARFGLFYSLDYVISQTSYKTGAPNTDNKTWTSQFAWNNLSTNIGLLFKLTSLNKKTK
jgi:hypothetical protein